MSFKHSNYMKKILLLPTILTLTFLGTVSQAQLLGPLHPDTAGFVELGFQGEGEFFDGELAAGAILGVLYADLDYIDPYEVYTWCFEIGLEYIYGVNDNIEEGVYGNSWQLGQAAPAGVIEGLFSYLGSAEDSTLAELLGLYNSIPGLVDAAWPAPLGLAPEDIELEIYPDDGFFELYAYSDDVNPEPYGGFAFYGEARLSLKGGGAAVPEPSTYGLIGAGFLVALVFLRRRNTGKRG